MRAELAALQTIHEALLAALAAEDTDSLAELIAARQTALERFQAAYEAAPAPLRRECAPAVEELSRADEDLLGRCRDLRDTLRGRLDGGLGRAETRERPLLTGILDRRA